MGGRRRWGGLWTGVSEGGIGSTRQGGHRIRGTTGVSVGIGSTRQGSSIPEQLGSDVIHLRPRYDEENEIIAKLASGETTCVECGNVALSYCTMFEDFFCLPCFARLHQKGHRKDAKAYKLEVCSSCKSRAAKLECSWTNQLFCSVGV